jgi:exosortase J
MPEQAELLCPVQDDTAPELEPAQPAAPVALWCGIALLAGVGSLGIYHDLLSLWDTWTTDPLRSIGLLIPPASIALTLRVWRQRRWELHGSWWGILVIALAYIMSWLRLNTMLLAHAGAVAVSVVPVSLPLYLYGSGVVLIFAGIRVWRKAWFPLGLLLFSQPVPILSAGLIDIPLQNISASVARRFATMIGLAPTTPQLRLMFSPDFGMFIAPGCDGIRGAVAMGYLALILGYLKRVSVYRWAGYVSGAVFLGYLFNFVRLCVLVLYYRAALGHPMLEGLAKQADYLIGACLFLVATLFLLWLARNPRQGPAAPGVPLGPLVPAPRISTLYFRCAALAAMLLVALSMPSSAIRYIRKAAPTPELLAALLPKQVGGFGLARTWYEQQEGTIVLENGTYSTRGSDEITLGVWIAPRLYVHDTEQCWLARGLKPVSLVKSELVTAGGQSEPFNTGYYKDGVTDSIVVSSICTPSSCTGFQQVEQGKGFGFQFLMPQRNELSPFGAHPVSIMLRIDRLHSNTPEAFIYSQLSDEARSFLAGLDVKGLSRVFQ